MIPELFTRTSSPPKASRDLFHHRLDLLRFRHIAVNHKRVLEFRRDIGRISPVRSNGIADEIDDTLRAAIAERFDHRCAEPARTTCHKDDFASEIERIDH